HRHLHMGKAPLQAALDAATEVATPVFVITVTIVVTFFPVVFLTGIGKFLFTPLAISVAFALGISYLLSLTLVPVCCARFLRGSSVPVEEDETGRSGLSGRVEERKSGYPRSGSGSRPERPFVHSSTHPFAPPAARFDRFRRRYERWLAAALRHRALVLGGAVA